MENRAQALQAWTALLGSDWILADEETVRTASTATFWTEQGILAILRPANRAEVQACVQIANRFQVALQPYSSGKNWGYGSRVPVTDGCALLDLSRLNHILDFNETLAYITVEPGVTQQQLADFLTRRDSQVWMDATGSSPECSLIGNALERGFGHTPYGEHCAYICGMEVVLPTGECIHTGLGAFPQANAAPVYRWGLGPYLDGLFTQSGLGIVTRMTFWLLPKPACFQAFYFSVEDEAQLGSLIEALRPLRLNGTLNSAIHIANGYKVLSSIRQYPWDMLQGQTPLSPAALTPFKKQLGFGAWNASGALYGTSAQVREARRLLRRALKGRVRRLLFINDTLLLWLSRLARPISLFTGLNLPHMLKLMRPVYNLMKGIPTESQLKSAYWRKKTPIPATMNPDADGCGLLWCAPVAPLTGEHALKLQTIATDVLLAHGFEPAISFSLVTGRSLNCIISITYDRGIVGEDARAQTCFQELLSRLTTGGYYPYRLDIQSMQNVFNQAEKDYRHLLQRLRASLDPAGILSPGRYEAITAEKSSSLLSSDLRTLQAITEEVR